MVKGQLCPLLTNSKGRRGNQVSLDRETWKQETANNHISYSPDVSIYCKAFSNIYMERDTQRERIAQQSCKAGRPGF